MADDKYTFEQARVRLEEIVAQVRRKDVSLETSIELLEEGVRLANTCTELSDHTEWQTVVEQQGVGPDTGVESVVAEDTEPGDTDGSAAGEDVSGDESPEPSGSDADADAHVVDSEEE